MAKKKARKGWPGRLSELQEKLGLKNEEMADKLGILKRTWLSWKYGERTPSLAACRLIELLEQGKF